MDRKNFENETFDEVPALILCSNFKHCTFNARTKFERCNLTACTFNVECEFDRSNVISQEELDRQLAEEAEMNALAEPVTTTKKR